MEREECGNNNNNNNNLICIAPVCAKKTSVALMVIGIEGRERSRPLQTKIRSAVVGKSQVVGERDFRTAK